MKFGQLIEYNMTHIFLENHTQIVVEKLFPDPFLKNKNWAFLWINSLEIYTACFYCMPSGAVFSTLPKNQDKNLNILRKKRVFKMK